MAPAEREPASHDTALQNCPRCGYDLSGAVDSWSDRCPLEGVCPECGLSHRWRDVLNPGFAIPVWFVENPNTPFRRGFPRTSARCFRPRSFWRDIWMTHSFVRGRVIAFVGAWVATAFVVMHMLCGIVKISSAPGFSRIIPVSHIDPITRAAQAYEKSSAWAWMLVLWAILTPLSMLALIHTRRLARVRGVHLLRGLAYGLPPIIILIVVNVGLRVVSYQRMPSWRIGWWNTTSIPQWEESLWTYFEVAEGFAVIFLGGVILTWCWMAITRRYMRLAQPRAAAAIMLVIAGLASLAIVETLTNKTILTDLMMRLTNGGFRID